MSGLARALLVKLHEREAHEIAANGMGRSWAEFRACLSAVRKQGFHRSLGEREAGIGAAVVPVFNADGDRVAALALVATESRFSQPADGQLREWLEQAVARIGRQMV